MFRPKRNKSPHDESYKWEKFSTDNESLIRAIYNKIKSIDGNKDDIAKELDVPVNALVFILQKLGLPSLVIILVVVIYYNFV